MRPLDTIAALTAFERRGPGTDAERRAALWLARELIDQRLRVRIETFWCRPNWALGHAWHVAVALAGSLLSVSHPTIGLILVSAALISVIADALTGISPGRRLTSERASQNIVAAPRSPDASATNRTRLIITANYDAGRTALVYRDALRRPVASLRRRFGPLVIGWLGWLCIAIAWLLAIAILRATTTHPAKVLGALQLPPTVALVLGLALLLDAAGARYGPAAGDNASGTAVAIALARTLAAAPPQHLTIELLLTGAGTGHELGIKQYLRAHKRDHRPSDTVVISISPCGAGNLHWWLSDGRLIPIAHARRLHELAAAVAREHPHLNAQPHRDRSATAATRARAKRVPAIAIGNLDQSGLTPRSHQSTDVIDTIDQQALTRAIEFGLLLTQTVDAAIPA